MKQSITFIVVIMSLTVLSATVEAGRSCLPCETSVDDGSFCGPCDEVACLPCDPCESIFRRSSGKKSFWDSVKVYGWIQAGITVNDHGNKNDYSGGSPASRNLNPLAGNSYILGFGQPSDLKVNQLWLGVTKAKDTRHGWDWGFQSDFMFGTDAKYAQCFGDQTFDYDWGSGDYYDSFVQLYAELGYKNLTFRVGKFATLMCYEAVPGPASFFYTHAYLCYNGPLTHNGAIAEYKINDRWTVLGGWTAGYHNSFENPLGDDAFLGQIRYTIDKDRSLTYTLYQGWHNGLNKKDNAATKYSRGYWRETETTMNLRYTWQMNKKWFYMIEGIWSQGNMKMPGDTDDVVKKTYGINQHLIYTINKKWSIGLRGEWLSGKGTFCDIAPITQLPGKQGGQGTDLYEITLVLNWQVFKNITIRPEIRYDWSFYKNGFKPFGGQDQAYTTEIQGRKSEQLTGGLAVIAAF